MKFCCHTCVVSFLAGGLLVGGIIAAGGFAQQPGEKNPAQPPSSPTRPGDKPPMPKPGELPAMPPEMLGLMGPGPEHAMLKQFEGRWNGKLETFGDMNQSSTGVMTNSWVLDGLWLRQEWTGSMMGMPFKGLGFWGFDRGAKKWLGTWMDTFSTGATISKGDYDADKKTWTMTESSTDPMGQEHSSVEKIIVIGPDEHVMEMWGDEDHDGKNELMMKITYTRAK